MQYPVTPSEASGNSVFDDVAVVLEHANTGRRFANLLIDMVFAYLVVFGIVLVAVILIPGLGDYINENDDTVSFSLMDRLLTIVVVLLTYTVMEGATKGHTLGKLLTGTVAVREDGSPITWKDALIRSLIRLVPFEMLSGLSGYPWHDKWSKTCVVRK